MYLVISKWVIAVKVSNFSGHYLRNRLTLDIGVLGFLGVVWPKEHSPEVSHIPPVTPCISSITKGLMLTLKLSKHVSKYHWNVLDRILILLLYKLLISSQIKSWKIVLCWLIYIWCCYLLVPHHLCIVLCHSLNCLNCYCSWFHCKKQRDNRIK